MELNSCEMGGGRRKLNSNVPEFIPKPKAPQPHSSKSALFKFDLACPPKSKHVFKNEFPRLQVYNDLAILKETFPCLRNINPRALDRETETDYIVADVPHLDDIHKAIKYGVFCNSLSEKNQFLMSRYTKNLRGGVRTVLLFRTAPDRLLGTAEVMSGF